MNDAHINAYAARNARLLERKKNRIRYLNGYTQQPASVEQMLANAKDSAYNHRRTLARSHATSRRSNRRRAPRLRALITSSPRRTRKRGDRANGYPDGGIGINDAATASSCPEMALACQNYPNAAHHTPRHRVRCHLQVWMRLQRANDEPGGRTQPRGTKTDLLAGKMTL